MSTHITINNRKVGQGCPVYCVAELSANHNKDFSTAIKLIEAAKQAGADAVKVQTYTPDTMTIRSDSPEFAHETHSPWADEQLYDLYERAYMPWEWQPILKKVTEQLGLDFFSTPFDTTAVDFLESMDAPAYKVASYELVDIPLLKYIAATGKPIILSTGMASLGDIGEAIRAIQNVSLFAHIALLKCTSTYPAPPDQMDLRSIGDLGVVFDVPVGLSDHTLSADAIPAAAVALGACIIEKHLTLSRNFGPDAAFSLEPHEFKHMVDSVRITESALGEYWYHHTTRSIRTFRRSLYVVADILDGEKFTPQNVRSIRPSNGMHPRNLPEILDARASQDIARGTPLHWEHVQHGIF